MKVLSSMPNWLRNTLLFPAAVTAVLAANFLFEQLFRLTIYAHENLMSFWFWVLFLSFSGFIWAVLRGIVIGLAGFTALIASNKDLAFLVVFGLAIINAVILIWRIWSFATFSAGSIALSVVFTVLIIKLTWNFYDGAIIVLRGEERNRIV